MTGKQGSTRTIRTRLTVLAGIVAIMIGVGTGSAMALFSANSLSDNETFTTGDLSVSAGVMTWEQVTPGVTGGASGVLSGSSPGFQSMPGDVIEIRVPLTTNLRGDNLAADMTVDCAPEPSRVQISASFHIEDAGGNQVAPGEGNTPIEEPLTVHGLLGSDAGTTAQWTVVVRVEVLGDYQWAAPQSSAIGWNAGTVHATLKQVRG